jgi:uncharacterized membrane protein YkoI
MHINKRVLVAVAVVGFVVVAQSEAVSANQGGMGSGEHRGAGRSLVSTTTVVITQARASEIALGQLPGTVKKIHLNRHHGKASWRVRVMSTDGTQRGDFLIDATTGDVLKSKIKSVKSHASVLASVTVTRDAAIATAQGLLPGTVKEAHLEREHGKATWDVRILSTDGTKRGDFRIDATTGTVLKSRIK